MQTQSDIIRYGESRAEDANKVALPSATAGAGSTVPPVLAPLAPVMESIPSVRAAREDIVRTVEQEAPNVFASMGAGIQSTYIARAMQLYEKPHFSTDLSGNWDTAKFVNNVPFSLQEEERKWLLSTKSPEEGSWTLNRIQEEREVSRVMGHNPISGMLGNILDPVQLGVDIASGGISSALKLGKVGTAVIAATGSAALDIGLARQVAPVENSQIILNSILNASGAVLAHSLDARAVRGISKVDQKFPDVALQTAVHDTVAELKISNARANPDLTLKGERSLEYFQPTAAIRDASSLASQVQKHFAGTQYEELASLISKAPELKDIRVSINPEHFVHSPNASGYFAHGGVIEGGDNLLWFKQGVSASVPLHELVHATLDLRIHSNPKLLAEIKTIQKEVFSSSNPLSIRSQAAKSTFSKSVAGSQGANTEFFNSVAGMNTKEFIAYAYTSPTFRALLDKYHPLEGAIRNEGWNAGQVASLKLPSDALPVPSMPKAPTLLQRLQDFFARVLGLPEKHADAFKALMNERNDVLEYNNHTPPKYRTLDAQLRRIMRTAFEGEHVAPFGTPGMYDVFPTIQQAAESVASDKTLAQKLGGGLEWSLHKSLGKFDKAMADLLVQSPTGREAVNVASVKDATLRGWRKNQYKFEDASLAEMRDRGFGLWQRITRFSEGLQVYREVQRDVQLELARRQDASRAGGVFRGENEAVANLADLHGISTDRALDDAVRAGVPGASDIKASDGYFNRHWDFTGIEKIQDTLTKAGATLDDAKATVVDLLKRSIQKANPDWDESLTKSVGAALYERAKKKAYYEDAGYVGHMGLESVQEVRTMLDSLGIPVKDKERVLEFMVGKVDEAGKVSSFKRRIDLDSSVELLLPNGTKVTYLDMVDQNLNTLLERYMDNLSGRVGLAAKGLGDASDITKLKLEIMGKLKTQAERDSFNTLFDDTIKALLGMPTGEVMNSFMRASSAFTQMVGLKWSGLYQLTEVANISAKYGLVKMFNHSIAQLPVFKQMYGAVLQDRDMASSLREVLTDYSSQDIRMRPLLQRYEDGFSMPVDAKVIAMLTQAKQAVPYMNALKFVHKWTARVASNSIVDMVQKAVKGDVKSAAFLDTYGLDASHLAAIKNELTQHGMDTSKWSDSTFNTVRTPLLRLMDDAILRTKLGEMPAFAQFSALGKFLFMFRQFTLASHNKLLSGTLQNQGFGGMAVLIAHQLPLAMLAVHAKAGVNGKKLKEDEAVQQALAQMGAWGGFSDMFSIISGKKRDIGTPGLIGIDKMVGLVSAMSSGKLNSEQVLNSMPLVAASPVVNAAQHLKD